MPVSAPSDFQALPPTLAADVNMTASTNSGLLLGEQPLASPSPSCSMPSIQLCLPQRSTSNDEISVCLQKLENTLEFQQLVSCIRRDIQDLSGNQQVIVQLVPAVYMARQPSSLTMSSRYDIPQYATVPFGLHIVPSDLNTNDSFTQFFIPPVCTLDAITAFRQGPESQS